MRDADIFGLARTRRDDGGPAAVARRVERRLRARDCPGLIDLDEHRRTCAGLGRSADARGIGHEKVVTDDLRRAAQRFRRGRHARGVVLRHRILDREDGIARAPGLHDVDHLRRVERFLVQPELVVSVRVELAGRDIERDEHIGARTIARPLDRTGEHDQRLLVRREIRPPAALVGRAGKQSLIRHQLAGDAVNGGGEFERLAQIGRPGRHDHEILDIGAPARMRAAAEDLDLRQRHSNLATLREMPP